ncbi:hypothetical protein ACHWQZ_G001253 [Mnemiopsis leidyi]
MTRFSHNRPSSSARKKKKKRVEEPGKEKSMSILTTAPIHTKIDIQIKLEGNANKEESGSSSIKSGQNSPTKKVAPLTLETAVELKYDLQETVIPYPQFVEPGRRLKPNDPRAAQPVPTDQQHT